MSSPATPSPNSVRPSAIGRIEGFWQRVSEGRAIDDLWAQFAADARSSYSFYGKDVDWDEINKLPRWKQPFRVAGQFFWALMTKLSPARRVLLLLALLFLLLAALGGNNGRPNAHGGGGDVNWEFFSAVLLLLLLSLELADRVIMKRDLEIAREIQTWLVPSQAPKIPGAELAFWTRPQNSVAGDYYDAFYPTANGAASSKLMLVMADVAGKSVPAALLMATLQASLRTIASESVPLPQLAERLNQYACSTSLGGQRFTTAVLAEYDPATRELQYVNAGHNSPVIRHKNGGTMRLESASLPLGITPEAQFTAFSVQLQPEDTLVLFTDGVVEAFNAAGEEFTDARWIGVIRAMPLLPAGDTLKYLLKTVEEFVGATRQSDDITCLVMRCQ